LTPQELAETVKVDAPVEASEATLNFAVEVAESPDQEVFAGFNEPEIPFIVEIDKLISPEQPLIADKETQ
jgi:hypothetical protein